MNPFEILPFETVSNVMTFCSGSDLLKLSETCKRFKKIIFESKKLMSKINLKVTSDDNTKFDEITKLVEEREFSAARLVNVHKVMEHSKGIQKTIRFLKTLDDHIEDLTVDAEINQEKHIRDVKIIIAMFLPKLKTCCVNLRLNYMDEYYDFIDAFENVFGDELEDEDFKDENFPLKALEINGNASLVRIFQGCNDLSSFKFQEETDDLEFEDDMMIERFLDHQKSLKVLAISQNTIQGYTFTPINESWFNMKFQLEELSIDFFEDPFNLLSLFLRAQKLLKKLSLEWRRFPSNKLLKAICDHPLLKSLRVYDSSDSRVECDQDQIEFLRGLSNNTVKEIVLECDSTAMGSIIDIFKAIETVEIYQNIVFKNPSHEILKQINVRNYQQSPGNTCGFHFTSPWLPESERSLENNVLYFLERHSSVFSCVIIGDQSWLSMDYKLSMDYCKRLVVSLECLPRLLKLQLYNVAELENFQTFLTQRADKIGFHCSDHCFVIYKHPY